MVRQEVATQAGVLHAPQNCLEDHGLTSTMQHVNISNVQALLVQQ